MKRISALILTLLLTAVCSLPGWSGTLTSNEFLFKPSLGARGATEKNTFDAGLDRIDARLGKEIWVGDPKSGATLTTAITALGATPAILRIPAGTHAISADLTTPATLTLRPERGAVLAVPDGKTLTLGSFEAGLYQTFSCAGTGKVVFAQGAVNEFYPQWWGVKGDGTTNDTVAMKAAVIAAQNQILRIPPGKYLLDGPCNLIDGVTGNITIIGSTRSDWGPQTVFYCKTVTGWVFDKNTAVARNPNGLFVQGIWFDGTNTGTDSWSGGTTCDGIYRNSGGGNPHRVVFINCTVEGFAKVGAVAFDTTAVFYTHLDNVKVSGITKGRAVKTGGLATTTYYNRCILEGCQEAIYAVNGNAAIDFKNCTIQSCTAAVVTASTSIKFDSCWFEDLGYLTLPGQSTGISNQQVNVALGSPYDALVNTYFNFVDSNITFDNCQFVSTSAYSAAAWFRLISSGLSSLDKSGTVDFRNCWGNDSNTKDTMPWFIKNGATGLPVSTKTEYQILLHGRGGINDGSRLFTRHDDLRQVNFGEFYASGQPGNQWRLVKIAGKRWTFLPWAAADSYAVTDLRYPSGSITPHQPYSATQADTDKASQGFRTGDLWVETHAGPGYPEKWALLREQRTTTAAAFVTADTAITVADTPTAAVGDTLKIVGASNTFSGTVLSINAGAKTITLADSAGSPTTVGFNSTADSGLFVQTCKWGAVGQQGYRSGTASPSGSVAPYFIGEMYLDSAAGKWYRSTGLLNTNWVALN